MSKQYKFLIPLATTYVTIALITIVMIYKVIDLADGYYISAATVIIPFWYAVADLVAEVYGYSAARNLIWSGIFCECVFILAITALLHVPSPAFWHAQAAYDVVLGRLPRILLGSITAILLGSFINVYILTKWKILLKGRRFWLRSFGSSIIGEGIFTLSAFTIEFFGIYSWGKIVELVFFSYLIKILFQPFASSLVALIASWLKRVEGSDFYDLNTDFNPFRLTAKEAS